ncbi:hypothetical protein PF005_g11824 [Phytophthora fragariae]|uniref:Vacuolar protein sorting-associated protein n=1 Tax=Phytophthora fragariae TaxID=53985 RepID=A0A6A3XW56_9STRA|nr:hypothetical protein PF007_g12056 [Phytophthora fragariae]KAE9209441.1 hypothetical protein PF005_g11824 [Phytophthora fragariae]
MFETLVTGLLTSALGSYIEPKCFSSDKINVAVWSGYVVLTELEVKPEVVAELPAVRLVRGLVGSIELKIPWNRLQSDSVVATVDDVYLLLRTEEDIDAVMRQMDEFTLKKKLLEELYAQAKRQEQETADAAATEGGFAARLVNKIIDNLELHIRRIHIRIEDHNSGDHPFAMGLTIESVHVQSTNSNWQPSYVDTAKNNEPRIFKIVELNHLSVYCNPDCELQRDRQVDFETCSAEEFSSAFSRAIPKRFDDRHYHHMQLYPSQQQHHFLLKPIDASARLIVNRDVFDANVPKFEVDMNVSEVAFRLEESQYCDMLYLASALQIPDHYTKYQRHRKFRPQAAVFDDPAEWWRYAITAVLKDQQAKKQQWTWGFMKDRREDRKQYVGLWQQKSHQLLELADVDYVYSDSDDNDDADDNGNTEDDEQGVKPGLSPLDQAHIQRLSSFEIDAGLEEIERRRSTEDVLFFRYLADLEVRNFRATRASRVRRRLPTPPTHKSHAFSDTDSVDTEITESSVPAEVRYRSWGAWMFGWTSKLATPSPDGEAGQAPHRIIPEVELRELFKILEEPSRRTKKRVHKHREAGGPDGVSDSESQMELSELYRVTVTLQRGSVTLASDPETNKTLLRDDPSYGRKYAPTDFLLGTFSQLQVAAVARDETVAVDVSLQSIEAFDESAESSAFSRLLSRKQTIRPAGDGDDVNVSKLSGVVFLMSYEMNPATSSADASLFVHMEPLEIVLSPTARCWGRLAKFMDTPSSLGLWEELEVASFNDIVNLKTRTEAKLDYVMENRIALAVDLRIQAPVIIVPESDTDYNCARLVVDLGRINFRTDRLSQMDSDQMSMSSTGGPPSSRSAPGSIALLSPSHFRGVNSNTSFVQQLYDEAERGEGAIRWKEEFYDKFSLSITNIHVLLIPYGKTSRVQDDGAGSSGMNYPSVSLPPYLTNIYDEEQEYELVERFNINVTVRMSILPLDATLTRFYIHADLPALTFNLSLEKYFQLLALADRFSLANAEVPKKTRKYSGGAFYPAESAYGNDEINMPNSEDGHEAMRRGSFLSTSALKKFMLNDNESIGPPSANGALADDAGDSDENASVESDDTWFSIYSGNLDQSASSLSGELEHNLSLSDFSDSVAKEDGRSVSIPPRSERRTRKRPRPYTPGGSTKLLDRRLMVCSFTVPLISVQLKKPRSAAVSSYTSYRYDTSDFDDDPADNGTILVKLQGFRVRVGQKTLSTQLDVSLMSLEVEDFHDASGRSTQYLLFSCPTIAAPFSIKAPLRRGGKFPGYAAQRKRPNRQRERVISFQVGGAKNSDGSVSASPETLLELGFSSLKDQKSGKEVLRDVDLQLGSVQFNFDQSYVCSLLELFEESSSQLALVPASSRNGMGSGDITSADTDDGLPPPFELTPTIKQEYSIPVNLTESVRADLERARKNLFEQAPDTLKIPVAAGDNDALPVALKLGIRLHSVSVCFSDRGESVVSLAVLDSQVQVGTAKAGQIDVSGLVGDVKVFDLSSKKRQEDGLGISGAARGLESPADYIEIFGLDTSASFSTGDIRHVLSVDCLISSESNLTASEGNVQARQNKSRLSVSVQPVRFLAQPEFVENLANYVVDGPLRTHFLSKHVALSDAGMENERKRADSMADFQLAPRFSPNADHPPESLTPFFDAVDTTNRDGRQLKFEATSPQTPPPCDIVAANAQENQSVQGNDSAKRDGIALIVAHIIDNFDLEVKLFHPCVVLPSTPLKDIRVSLQSQPYRGIVLDFGTILITLRREISDALPDAPVCTPYQAKVTVKSLQITSLADQTAILDPSGFEIRCSIPAQDMNYDDRGTNGALPGISLDVEIYQVCLNVSETNACLALEVFYVAVIPMFDTTQEVIRQLESYERVLVAEPATLRPEDGGDLESASFGANGDMTKWGQLSLHFLLEEFKIACISYSEAPQQFETWMKSVIDIPDEVSSRESSGGASSAAQGRSYPQHFMGRRGSFPSEIPCCVIGKIALVAIEANLAMGLEGKPLMDSDVQLQCDFSLQEVIIRDKIADPTEFLTHLFAPVPGALLERMDSRTSISSDSSSISFLSRDDMLPPVLRPSTSHSSRMDVSSSQISGRLISKRGVGAGFDSAVTVNSLDVSVSSARFILLPRTLLRLEHFVLDVFLAASKKRSEMEIQRDEALVNNPPGVENAAYADAAIDMDDNRGERQESRFTVPPLRPRNDSISESLKDDLNAVRSAFMSPLQRMLSSASAKDTRPPGSFTSRVIAEETGSGTSAASKTKSPGSVGQGDADRRRLPIPQWKVDARFSNLQMWVISTDRKADVAGCVLSHQLIVKFDSALNGAETSTASDSNEIVAASVRLSKVEVSVGSPKTAELDFSTAEPQSKPTYHTGTLVESFEVDVQFVLRHCFRPTLAETIDPESSDEKSDENSEMNSGDAYNGDTGGDADAKASPWVNYSPTNKADSAAVSLPELFLRDVPSEWQEWLLCEPTVRIDQIVSHIAYRDLPLLLKISASLASMLSAEKKIRDAFVARLKTATDDLDWTDLPDAPGDYSEYAHYFGAEDLDDSEVSRQDEPSVPQYDVLTRASLIASGIQFRLINNIVDQASPVVEFDSKAIEVLLRSESNSMVEVTACCRAEAMYQNLRLVTMEPLIEPWSVKVVLSQQRSHGRSLDDRGQLALSPWKLDISSDVFLQLNLTDALIANLVAADRAWRWVVNAGGDSREMTEYSTYWIRNNTGMNAGWETREQRLRERGTISAADSLIWHLSSEETPLELSVRMKGFDWSEPLELDEDLGDIVRIKMKDLVSDAYLYITAEIRMSKGHCRELFLYVPYWIVNLTGLKLEYEYDEERMGREHTTTLLAGQKRLDRDELLLKESQRAKASRRDRNPHLLHPVLVENQEFIDGVGDIAQQSKSSRSASPDSRESERKRRHPRLLPSVPPVKGLLDLLPKTIEYDPRSLGQLEVLQACHSDYRLDRGCVRLRVSNDRDMAALDARKENGQRKWSDPFVLDQAGTIGEIEADDYGANRKFSIGYSIIPAKGQYSRTKVIMLTPRFMLINTMSSAIEVCHSSSKMMTPSVIDMANTTGSMPNSRVMSPVNPVVQLDAGAFADFHWTLRFAKTRTIRCRFAEYGWSWSGAVPLVESGEYAVRMRHESTRESKLVRVTLKLDSSCVCVYFREERTTAPPYRVENYSLETLRTHQHRVRRSEILLPHHSLDYAWDEPTEERLLVVDMLPSAAGDNSRPLRIGSFDLDKIQQYPDALGGTLGIEISTDGPTRVLRFTDTRLRGKKAVPVNSKVANDLAAKTEGTENSALQLLQRFVAVPTVHAALHLQGVGISIADSAPKELVYMSISGIALEILVSEDDRNKSAGSIAGSAASLSRLERETRPRIIACCLEVNDVQVDNQLQVTPYPVLLRFSNPNGRSRIVNGQTVSIPVLQVGLVKHDEYAGIEFIRHFSVSVLPVHIRVDGALLYQILPLLVHAKIYGSGGNSATTTKKRAVVLVNGGSSSDEVSRAAHSHLLLKDFNASLEVPVKVLEAAQKDGTTSAGPTSGPPTPTMKMVSRRSSGQQQLISPRQNHQHTALAAEIQRYTATKYGSIGAIAVKDEQKKLYFEEFHIDPIRATVSFSFGDSAGAILDGHLSSLSHAAALTDPSSSRDSSVITVGPLRLILNAIGTSLTKIANAPFQLKALHIHNSFVQPDALATRLASHYQSEALRQAYVILGSVDVLGNPMIAWKNLRSGFQDFISEPAHGLSQRSPQAFAFGVGRGSLSLVRASVYTFLDFNTRILTAFSLGLSEACLKLDDYTGYPATRHIFQGLVQGVSGVVVAPIHSFEVNGARGVLPGLVAGAFGVVLKPLLGFSLATATTAATLRDAVDPNTKALLVRVRPPRHIDLRTKRLKVYSYVESLGEEIVGKIRGGRYRADGYLGHVDLKATHQCFLVTRKRILFLNVKGLASAQTTKYEVQWELLAEEVVMVDCSRTPSEQIITIYYMEDEFRAANGAGHSARVANGSNAVTTTRRRTPGVPRGMFLQKHEVALPDTKVLFVRAMLQQQERSLLTKMNSYTKDGTPHHLSPLARTNSMDLSSAWQPQHPHMPMEYPIFRLPPSLHQTRSFANLAQTNPSHTHHYNQQQKS